VFRFYLWSSWLCLTALESDNNIMSFDSSMQSMHKSLYETDNFTDQDFLTVAGISFSIMLLALTIGRNVFPEVYILNILYNNTI
jgi:hypothetical protein